MLQNYRELPPKLPKTIIVRCRDSLQHEWVVSDLPFMFIQIEKDFWYFFLVFLFVMKNVTELKKRAEETTNKHQQEFSFFWRISVIFVWLHLLRWHRVATQMWNKSDESCVGKISIISSLFVCYSIIRLTLKIDTFFCFAQL